MATASLPLSFFEECSQHLMLMRGGLNSLGVKCPVRIFHGMRDRIVPASVSRRLMDCLMTEDVHVSLIKVRRAACMRVDSNISFDLPARLAFAICPTKRKIKIEKQKFFLDYSFFYPKVSLCALYMQDGNHRLSRAQDLSPIMATVAEMEDY